MLILLFRVQKWRIPATDKNSTNQKIENKVGRSIEAVGLPRFVAAHRVNSTVITAITTLYTTERFSRTSTGAWRYQRCGWVMWSIRKRARRCVQARSAWMMLMRERVFVSFCRTSSGRRRQLPPTRRRVAHRGVPQSTTPRYPDVSSRGSAVCHPKYPTMESCHARTGAYRYRRCTRQQTRTTQGQAAHPHPTESRQALSCRDTPG